MSDIKNGQLKTVNTLTKNSANVDCCVDLRDYFAGQALNGMLSDPNLSAEPEEFADYAYRHADAMLKARCK
jgi:hypothetical protein